jgi:peptide/nickel transport system substrate-binding protein
MRGIRQLGVLLLVIGLLAAACGGGGTTETTASTTSGSVTTGAAVEVKNPGVFVHALGGEPVEGLDPAQVPSGGFGDRTIIQVYEGLLGFGPDGPDPIPELATEVPTKENGLISEDGLVYTFNIRQGVKFHDGTDLTAEDVRYSWDRVMTMAMPEGQSSTLSDIIESTRVVDDYTFEVTLQEPAAWFVNSVVTSVPASIVSKDAVEANGGVVPGRPNDWMVTHEAGTGPYMLTSWDRNVRLTFQRFPDYWGEPAKLDVRFEVVPDSTATILGIAAGDYDLVEPSPQFLEEISSNPDVCPVETGYLMEPLILAFNLDIPVDKLPATDTIPADFFWDKRVRQAFAYAFNYDAYINGGLAGYGAVATYITPGLLGWSSDLPKYSQDLAKAEQLFRETGWWDMGFTVSVLVEGNNPTFTPLALILKDSLESLNPKFRVNVLQVAETQFDEAHSKTPFEYAMWVKNADPFTDPYFLMWTYQHPDGPWGEALGFRNGYENPDEIASLIDQAGEETNRETRVAMYRELVQKLYDDPMWIWAADEKNVQIMRCWVKDFVYNPLWIMPKWRYYDKG